MKKNCSSPGCTNKCKHKRCRTCESRIYRQRHPHMYAFNAVRNNARRRGIEFTITIEDFNEFCFETQYMKGKGVSIKSLTIDRIRDHEGYVKGNLQALPQSENSRKKKIVYDHFAERKYSVVTINKFSNANSNYNDVPF